MKKLLLALAFFGGITVANAQEELVSEQVNFMKNDTEKAALTFNPTKAGHDIGAPVDVNVAQEKAPKKGEILPGEIIREQPEGRLVQYEKNGTSWRVTFGTYYAAKGNGYVTSVVYGDNNEVYIKDPFLFKPLGTWIKGKIEGDYMVFQPQPVYYEQGQQYNYTTGEYEDYEYHYSVRHMKCDLEKQCYYLAEDQSFRYKITENGFELDVPDLYDVAGLYCDEDEAFVWYGDYACDYNPMPTETISLPEGVTADEYIFNHGSYTDLIKVGIVGDDVYLGGIPFVDEGVWVKGTFNAEKNKLIIKSGQFVGKYTDESELDGRLKYIMGARFVLTEDYTPGRYYYEASALEEVALDYDPATKTFTTITENSYYDGFGFVVNFGKLDLIETPNHKGRYLEIKIYPYEEVAATPVAPQIYELGVPTGDREYGYIGFRVQNKGTEGEFLNTDNLYYRLWLNGQPFTLTKDVYYELSEDMTTFPYGFTTETQIKQNDGYVTGYHQVLFYFSEFETLGVQTIYKFEDKEYRSQIYQYNMVKGVLETVDEPEMDGVSDIVTDAVVGSETYYDIMGNRLSRPRSGINIRRAADGTVTKILVK